jgi:hypothetical protein
VWRGGGQAYRGATRFGSSAYEGASRFGSSAYEGVSHYGAASYRGASRLGSRAQQSFFDVLEREPLVLGALGLAIGAAIGAMLPRTEVEDRFMGETRDRLRDDAEAYAREQMERGKEVAGDVYRAAKDKAEEAGLMPGQIAEKAGEVARAAKEEASGSATKKGAGSAPA